MKKTGALIILLLVFSLAPLVLAANESSTEGLDKIEKGFKCLEEKAVDCSKLTTQEIALTILATPENIFDKCVSELKSRRTSDNWDGNIRDTALGILALKHAGEDTEASEKWILQQNRTSTELIWYLEQDSNEAVECNLAYNGEVYSININENRKIDRDAGPCLKRGQSNFWLKISPNCYDNEFELTCDKNFIATPLYKSENSRTIYVLEGTSSSPASSTIKLSVRSKCFGTSSCDYEATAWAVIALLQTNHNVNSFIPYLIAMTDTNKKYLPEAFIYMITNYEEYANKLVLSQKLDNYWKADNSAYNKFYDTSLALIALSGTSSSDQVKNAKDRLLFAQGTNGCWQDSVRDTSIILWALSGRAGRSGRISGEDVNGDQISCTEAGYFCSRSEECPSDKTLGNYFCNSLSTVCCETENLKTCEEYGGEECTGDESCKGNERKASDSEDCCTGRCEEESELTECESESYTCKSSCSDSQESTDDACEGIDVCCKPKPQSSEGVKWWIWLLIVMIIAVLIAIAYLYREKLKLLWFQLQSKFKKGGGGKNGGYPRPRPGMPPKPGFPPVRRQQIPVQRGQIPVQRGHHNQRDKSMSDTFKKLSDMSR